MLQASEGYQGSSYYTSNKKSSSSILSRLKTTEVDNNERKKIEFKYLLLQYISLCQMKCDQDKIN